MKDEKTKAGAPPALSVEELKAENAALYNYIRTSTNRMLRSIGTAPLGDEELAGMDMLKFDPIGVIASSFEQILENLHLTNDKLKLTHEELKAVFDSTGVAIIVVDGSMKIVSYNLTASKMFLKPDPTRCYEAICGQGGPPEICTLCQVFEERKQVTTNEISIGEKIYKVIGTPVMAADNSNVTHVVLAYADITDRIRSMEAVEASEKRFRDLFENANDLIQAVTPDGRFLYVNSQWKKILGYPADRLGELSIVDIIAPEARRDYLRAMDRLREGAENIRIETVFLTCAGKQVELDGNVTMSHDSSSPAFFRGIFRDVTAQRKLEEEFNKAQRLESVGVLAGGIAHDFNNLLTGILGNISLARLYMKEGLDITPKLGEAEKAALRAQELTRQLLTFSRGGSPVKRLISIGAIIHDAVVFASSGSKVTHSLSIPQNLWPITADPAQIDQIVQNLVMNAVQAMPDGGELRVDCKNISPEEAVDLPPFLENRHCVQVEIGDEGMGIPQEYMDRIFDPYFSTREEGMGLGLATVYSVVRSHGGHVVAANSPGHGAKFTICLPAEPKGKPKKTAEPPVSEPQRGDGNILIMDDDEIVLDLVADLLGHLGYSTEKVTTGEKAVECYLAALRRGDPFDAVILDLTIRGGMGGKETVREIKKIDPEARAIVSSGYSQDPVMSQYRQYGFDAVVAKPYRGEALANALKGLLNGSKKG
ncbi:PAS domain S-box protein [bacterium]|nr:MAG: PAS domain S-box protein [bacterium]